ncbi:MAG: hypothetical protein K8R16_00320 [Anaerolineales bacterium]|nr:hypothetical protein [Anaerolineales bacterium]
MKNNQRFFYLMTLLILLLPASVNAQESQPDLNLYLIRNFGYGGIGEIQGNFTLKIRDPLAELDKIEFYLDEELIATILQEPYEYKFHTSSYPEGEHTLIAVGTLVDGTPLKSNRITKVFLSSGQAWSETEGLIVPVLLFAAGITILGLVIPVLLSRKKDFVLGKYGPAGGTVCPRCDLPFSRFFLSPNLLVGKLVRCPHCGKISIQARASQDQLQEAEKKYKNEEPSKVKEMDDQGYQKMLDESRFED